MSVGLIWAQAANGVIGDRGELPWHLPEDLARFRSTTWGSTVVMGRFTWESLPAKLRPLPGRRNIVLSRRTGWQASGATVERSLAASLERAKERGEDVWVIGGAAVFGEALAHADVLVVTELQEEFAGDVQAPLLGNGWRPVQREPTSGWLHSRTGLHYRTVTYQPPPESITA